jgi:hypothetical protein
MTAGCFTVFRPLSSGCYSILIACSGQASTHTPQSMQASGFTCAFSSTIEMASLGHSLTQASQAVHFSLSTFAGITKPFPKKITKFENKLYAPGYGSVFLFLFCAYLRLCRDEQDCRNVTKSSS